MSIRLIQVGRMRQDATAKYDVILDEECTLREFLTLIFKRNEWGCVGIKDEDAEEFSDKCWGYPRAEYRYDELTSYYPYKELFVELYDRKIKNVTADGGWGRIDYKIELEEVYDE